MPDAIPSPQAQLPIFRTWDELLRADHIAQQLSVLSAQLKTGTSEEVFPAEDTVAMRFLQNCGTNAVKVAIGDTAASTDYFHFIIAGGNAEDDGLGSIVDVSKYKGAVTVYSAAAHRIATFRAYAPEKNYAA